MPPRKRQEPFSEYERLFGTKTGRGVPLTREQREEETRRKRIEAKRKNEALRRAQAVLRYRHEPEFQQLYESEYEALGKDKRFLLGGLDR